MKNWFNNLNLHYLIRVLAGRTLCLRGVGSQIGRNARIINIGGPSNRISIGARSIVDGELLVFPHGGSISLGEWCYVGSGTRIWSGGSIEIGNRVLISNNVSIVDNLTHPISPKARHKQFQQIYSSGHPKDIELDDQPVRILDDAWIAMGATILRGVTIGRGAIVGAASVVTRDVPDYTIVAGNPARVIRILSLTELN